ncbi:hypothetical protein SERLA73DRAFT_106602 [Serpula lacrymans var. lacrymans S7.3]|uniref:Uncharacterized protein n=2 Tax=Serpula lacrymans var. lacrymans TaxID=341189 RepID=F8PVA2_SERL3|nr:uncharacterized protein SERLADRAFT_414986 [Serpula lacrymans var. lacrymans S7.9]EGN99794.1 hypothetical protein SERLA73DRAFT_106602 [Serpula lacrymans var. lacrymans S7.3]EGO25366.1 hypothetical protein SERLADRAFT_414986 [Serpula lacrymans var. lacrymans S7.9]
MIQVGSTMQTISFIDDFHHQIPHTPRYHREHIVRSKTADPSYHPARPSAVRRPSSPHENNDGPPWAHMAQTYAWVADQEHTRLDKQNRKTEQWVTEQIFLANRTNHGRSPKPSENGELRWKMIDELMYDYEVEAQRWMKQEESRRKAAEREQEKARIVQDEIKRIQTRVRQRTQSEKQKIADERQREYEATKLRERKERVRAERAKVNAWTTYESRWTALPASSEPLTFGAIPWPLFSPPATATDIIPANIIAFVLSPVHSQSQSRRERARSALLRWHPDRFRRILARVTAADKGAVEEGVGIVTRCLNELMAKDVKAP